MFRQINIKKVSTQSRQLFSFLKKENQNNLPAMVSKNYTLQEHFYKNNEGEQFNFKDCKKHYCFLFNDTKGSPLSTEFYNNITQLIKQIDDDDFYSVYRFGEIDGHEYTGCEILFGNVIGTVNRIDNFFGPSIYYGCNLYHAFHRVDTDNQIRCISKNLFTVYVIVTAIPDTTFLHPETFIMRLANNTEHNRGIIFVGIGNKIRLDPIYDLFSYEKIGNIHFTVPVHLETVNDNKIKQLGETMCKVFKKNN